MLPQTLGDSDRPSDRVRRLGHQPPSLARERPSLRRCHSVTTRPRLEAGLGPGKRATRDANGPIASLLSHTAQRVTHRRAEAGWQTFLKLK